MTVSKFLNQNTIKITPPKELPLKKSNFAGGQDSLTSIEELGQNVSPYLRNVRNTHQGSIGTKKGPGYYSQAAGQATDIAHTSTTGAADTTITNTAYAASSFVAGATKRLVEVDLRVKSANATAPLLVELWSDNSGVPGSKLAGTSISAGVVTASYLTLPAYFIEAPLLASGTTYWIVCYLQSNGTGSYSWSTSSSYTGGKTSTNTGLSWTTGNGGTFSTILATDGSVLGGDRFAFSNGSKINVIAIKEPAGTTGVYYINDATGAPVAIKSGLSASASYYSFAIFNDYVVFVNGYDGIYQFTSDLIPAGVTGIVANLANPPMLVANHKNRLFVLDTMNRVVFCEPGDITTWLSTNFFYVPSPKSGDPVNSMFILQDNLWFGTRKAGKYTLYGSDLSSFVLRHSTATKGTMNQQSVYVDGNFAYFASDDGIYSCNGTTDELMSRSITPDYMAIPDLTKTSIIVWNNELRFYCPQVGQTYNSQLFLWDLVNGGWFIDNNAYISRAIRYQAKGDPIKLLECSSLVGQVFVAEQQYSDLGKPIKLEYFDAPLCMGDPGVFKQILFYYVRFVAQNASYTVDCQMDKELQNSPASTFVQMQGGGAKWGSVNWGSFLWGQSNFDEATVPVNGEYRWFQPRFVITGADTPIELQGYSMRYLIEQPR